MATKFSSKVITGERPKALTSDATLEDKAKRADT